MAEQDTGLIDVEIPNNDDSALPLAKVVEGRGLAKGNADHLRVITRGRSHASGAMREVPGNRHSYRDARPI